MITIGPARMKWCQVMALYHKAKLTSSACLILLHPEWFN